MPWNTPNTSWVDNQIVGASDMNEIGENLNYLLAQPNDYYNVNEASNYQTTGTTFADVDTTDLGLTITTNGGDVLIGFQGSFVGSTTLIGYLDVEIDGVRDGGDDGYIEFVVTTTTDQSGAFVRLKTGLSAASHTFKLQWKTSTGTLTMYAGAGTATHDIHPQFWVKEV